MNKWVSTRPTKDSPWGEPGNLGPPINTSPNEDKDDLIRRGGGLKRMQRHSEAVSTPEAGLAEGFGRETFGDQDTFDDYDLLVHDFVCLVTDELDVSLESFGRLTSG
jgi:hypothetical protein